MMTFARLRSQDASRCGKSGHETKTHTDEKRIEVLICKFRHQKRTSMQAYQHILLAASIEGATAFLITRLPPNTNHTQIPCPTNPHPAVYYSPTTPLLPQPLLRFTPPHSPTAPARIKRPSTLRLQMVQHMISTTRPSLHHIIAASLPLRYVPPDFRRPHYLSPTQSSIRKSQAKPKRARSREGDWGRVVRYRSLV